MGLGAWLGRMLVLILWTLQMLLVFSMGKGLIRILLDRQFSFLRNIKLLLFFIVRYLP